jgi:diadenosine tetraphosphate (Ap4A) HIT family hydrolase
MTCLMCSRWAAEPYLRIAALKHCFVLLNADQFFRGYTFVVTRRHVTELFHLDLAERQEIIEEVNRVAAALFQTFRPAKMNYELLGNMVPHMHWHLVPRFTDDPLWPRPIWSEPHVEKHLAADQYRDLIGSIQTALVSP